MSFKYTTRVLVAIICYARLTSMKLFSLFSDNTEKLSSLCRHSIRTSLGKDVNSGICSLPLPEVLKDYLCYKSSWCRSITSYTLIPSVWATRWDNSNLTRRKCHITDCRIHCIGAILASSLFGMQGMEDKCQSLEICYPFGYVDPVGISVENEVATVNPLSCLKWSGYPLLKNSNQTYLVQISNFTAKRAASYNYDQVVGGCSTNNITIEVFTIREDVSVENE